MKLQAKVRKQEVHLSATKLHLISDRKTIRELERGYISHSEISASASGPAIEVGKGMAANSGSESGLIARSGSVTGVAESTVDGARVEGSEVSVSVSESINQKNNNNLNRSSNLVDFSDSEGDIDGSLSEDYSTAEEGKECRGSQNGSQVGSQSGNGIITSPTRSAVVRDRKSRGYDSSSSSDEIDHEGREGGSASVNEDERLNFTTPTSRSRVSVMRTPHGSNNGNADGYADNDGDESSDSLSSFITPQSAGPSQGEMDVVVDELKAAKAKLQVREPLFNLLAL